MSRVYKSSGYKTKKQIAQAIRDQRTFKSQTAYAKLRNQIALGAFVPGMTRTTMKYVRSTPGSGEVKFNDSAIDAQTITTAGLNVSFNGVVDGVSVLLIPQGTTDNTRIGNKIVLQNIRLRGTLRIPANDVSGDRVRMILYRDMQTNGAAAAVTDLLATAAIDSYYNMDNIGRFKIIKDKFIDLNPGSGTDLAGSGNLLYLKGFKMNHKAMCHINYSSTTGAITELRTDNYALLVISEIGLATIQGALRVTFKE